MACLQRKGTRSRSSATATGFPRDARRHRGSAADRRSVDSSLGAVSRNEVRGGPQRACSRRRARARAPRRLGGRTPLRGRCSRRSAKRGAGPVVSAAGRIQSHKANHRTHRKVLVVDEQIGFTGGVGIADEWTGDARNEREWRDTHFRMRGPAVDGLRGAFLSNRVEADDTLFDATVDRFPDRPAGAAIVQTVRSAFETGWSDISTLFRALLELSEERIQITRRISCRTPAERADRRRSGARSASGDPLAGAPHRQTLRPARRGVFVQGFLERDIGPWPFQPSMLAAKIMTMDGVAACSVPRTSTRARPSWTKRSTWSPWTRTWCACSMRTSRRTCSGARRRRATLGATRAVATHVRARSETPAARDLNPTERAGIEPLTRTPAHVGLHLPFVSAGHSQARDLLPDMSRPCLSLWPVPVPGSEEAGGAGNEMRFLLTGSSSHMGGAGRPAAPRTGLPRTAHPDLAIALTGPVPSSTPSARSTLLSCCASSRADIHIAASRPYSADTVARCDKSPFPLPLTVMIALVKSRTRKGE